MKELLQEIEVLKSNMQGMMKMIHELRKIELQQKKEIGDLQTELQNGREKIRFLEEKSKMAGMASAIEPGERDEMKGKISELVKEIDGCIAMIKS